MEFNVLISGTGGQGSVLASKLIAVAAQKKGFSARTTETIGMAQRGGCVTGHLRLTKDLEITASPILARKSADMILAMELAETVRVLPFLKDGGIVISCNNAVFPITGGYDKDEMMKFLKTTAPNALIADSSEFIAKNSANAKALNVFVLSFAAANGKFPFDLNDLQAAICETIPEKFLELNLTAFNAGKDVHYG